MRTSIGDKLSALQGYVDDQCKWPYEYKRDGEGDCLALTVCAIGAYESKAPTPTSNRECTVWSVCEPRGKVYEVIGPSPLNNRVCSAVSKCTSTEFQLRGATAKTDIECQTINVCASDEFETSAPTPTSDRSCQSITVCAKGFEEKTKPTKVADRVCQRSRYASCAERTAKGVRDNGLALIETADGTLAETYCLNTIGGKAYAGGSWTLVMKMSKNDGAADFYHNGRSWSQTSYRTIADIGGEDLAASANAGSKDFISTLYERLPAKNILVLNNLNSPKFSVFSSNNCISGRSLHAVLSPGTKSCNGYACCNANYGAGTPKHNSYDTLLLNGDECADTEPGKIALRNSCGGDSETLQLGYTRLHHGNNEVFSQGDHWPGVSGFYIFVK
eukprot:m.98038 g.98038  ORF g.98038 m.98038 type:complete len:388 (-) comp27031_c0_seq2:85-1248(-)